MRKNNEKILLYMGLCLAVLPVILLRDFTPANELRYLSLAEEALREHRWWAFTNQGEVFADKPPLYLWGSVFSAATRCGSFRCFP